MRDAQRFTHRYVRATSVCLYASSSTTNAHTDTHTSPVHSQTRRLTASRCAGFCSLHLHLYSFRSAGASIFLSLAVVMAILVYLYLDICEPQKIKDETNEK